MPPANLKHAVSKILQNRFPKFPESIQEEFRKQESDKTVLTTLNRLLGKSKSQTFGLELVQDLVPFCPEELLSEHVLYWSNCCTITQGEDKTRELKLNTLAKILQVAANLDSFHKKFASELLNSTLSACLSNQSVPALNCLTQCMKKYPAWFGNHKNKVESYLIECLDTSEESVAKAASLAFVCFLQTGAAGVKGVNYVSNFRVYFQKLSATVWGLYDRFLKSLPELNQGRIEGEGLQLKDLPKTLDSQKKSDLVANRINNCLAFLKAMISKSFPVKKIINPSYIMDIIHRGLAVHVCFSHQIHFSLLRIQLNSLELLRLVIEWNQPFLKSFSSIVENVLLNLLRQNSKCECFNFDLLVKTSAYRTLTLWLTFHEPVNEEVFQRKLVPILIKDVSPQKKSVCLQSDKKITPNESETKTFFDTTVSETNCIYALTLLKRVLLSNYILEPLLNDLLFVVITTLEDIQKGKSVELYQNQTCQVKLYTVYISILQSKNLGRLPLTLHRMSSVLRRGLQNSNCEISKVSKKGLSLIKSLSFAVCPNLVRNRDLSDSLDLEEPSSKKIKVLSNILIEDVLEDKEESEMVCEEEVLVVDSDDGKEVVEEENGLEVDDVIEVVEQVSEENVAINEEKKSDDGLDDMLGSFQDVVQE